MVIRFTGRSIRIVGPVGPTRGRAALRLDGRPLRTIDLWARHFTPRRDLVTLRWAVSGTHRIELRVLGTRGRPAVAIDRIVTGR